MESKKINQLATELTPALSDLTIIGDPTTGISKKITLSQMASLFTGTVEEYANLASFPLVGAADTIYIALDTNVLYRWDTGLTSYVELSPNIINSLVFNDANGFDGTISLVGSVATLTITTALTTGSVGFIGASGALLQDNANFFWDDTNNRLGIGTNAPTTAIDTFGSGIITRVNGTSTNNAFIGFASAGTNKWSIGNVQSDHRFRIYNEATTSELVSVLQTGEFGIGIANPTTKLHIDGGSSALIANLDANVSVAKSISFRSDNSARINLEVSGTESGSNAGANFFLRAYSDAGALLNTPLTIARATGNATFVNNIAIANQTLSAWGATFGIMQSYYGSYFGATSGGGTVMGNNNYFDGTNYKYVNTDFAGQIQIGSGNILFRVAASGTSGNNVTFTNALTIASTGDSTFSNSVTAGGSIIGNKVGSATGAAFVASAAATVGYAWSRTDQATDAKNIDMIFDGTSILLRSVNDAVTSATNLLSIARSTGNATFSGKVGVGTSPNAQLHVSGQDIYLTGQTDNRIRFSNFGFTGNNMGAAIGYVYGVANTQEQGNLVFYTNPNFNGTGSLTEQVRIVANGNINFNATVYNNTAVATTRTLYIGSDYRIGGISSIRESKKNIENISNVNWIYKLNPVTFNYRKKNEEGEYTDETYNELVYGLIAEDTQPIADFLINYNEKNGEKQMIGIEYSRLITPLLKSVQELKAEIELLKSK